MNLMENALTFFSNCESAKGWEACKDYVEGNGTFICEAEPLAEVTEIKEYVDWMAGLGNSAIPGSSFEIHASALDEKTKTAMIFATFTATHSGEGGPVPPTNKTAHSHYVFALKMNDAGRVESATKIWNSSWALKGLGWM